MSESGSGGGGRLASRGGFGAGAVPPTKTGRCDGGLIPGLEHDERDVAAVGGRGHRAGILAGNRDAANQLPRGRIEDIDAVVLAGDGHEGASAREHDVGGLVSNRQGGDQPLRRRVDDAHAVREVVHDPDLVRARSDGEAHGLEADGDVAGEASGADGIDREDRDARFGRVDGVEAIVGGREGQRMDVARFVVREVAARRAQGPERQQGDEGASRPAQADRRRHGTSSVGEYPQMDYARTPRRCQSETAAAASRAPASELEDGRQRSEIEPLLVRSLISGPPAPSWPRT